uniref:Uncharacterized protein n=1 Tax=Ditylenchus dipsaci TaxID=166011 RepID=A0A915CPM9_9BILA
MKQVFGIKKFELQRNRDSDNLYKNSRHRLTAESITREEVKPRKTHCGEFYDPHLEPLTTDLIICCWASSVDHYGSTFPPEEISKYIFEEELIDEDDQKIKTGRILLSGAIKSYWKDCIFSSSEKLDNSLEICYFLL